MQPDTLLANQQQLSTSANAPTIPTLSFPTPTNDIYAPNMKRMSLNMASDIPSPHLQQHDATGHTPPKNKKENN